MLRWKVLKSFIYNYSTALSTIIICIYFTHLFDLFHWITWKYFIQSVIFFIMVNRFNILYKSFCFNIHETQGLTCIWWMFWPWDKTFGIRRRLTEISNVPILFCNLISLFSYKTLVITFEHINIMEYWLVFQLKFCNKPSFFLRLLSYYNNYVNNLLLGDIVIIEKAISE